MTSREHRVCPRRASGVARPGFCPTEPEFNILARRLIAPYVEALRRARQLLVADVREELKPKPSREEIEAMLGPNWSPMTNTIAGLTQVQLASTMRRGEER